MPLGSAFCEFFEEGHIINEVLTELSWIFSRTKNEVSRTTGPHRFSEETYDNENAERA